MWDLFRLIFISIFFIFFTILFLGNTYLNVSLNDEFFIAFFLLIILFVQYILFTVFNLRTIYSYLEKTNFNTLTIHCFTQKKKEHFSDQTSPQNSPQINEINQKYGSSYLKIDNHIPISFFNSKTNDYQFLRLSDFYYPGSYCSYLADSPLHGTPSLEALRLVFTQFNCRIIHLDIYSDKPDNIGDPTANPIVRCEFMKKDAVPLSLEDCFKVIQENAWSSSLSSSPSSPSYPLFLYLNFKFSNNDTLYNKIYHLFIKYFSKNLVDRKYSFSGRNSTFSIAQANIKDCLNKIILITNVYPTRNVLDELINSSFNDLNQDVNLYQYKESYITFDKIGLSQDYDKNQMVQRSKTELLFFYTMPNEKYQDPNNTKMGLYNPNFQDCGQYGIQSTLMYLFVPDDNLNKWYMYFLNKNNSQPVLKEESLRYLGEPKIPIVPQDKLLALQEPQTYCITPGKNGIKTQKSNITDKPTNNTCK